MEIYRYLIDDFLIGYCRNLKPKDFIVKTENLTRKKKGKREYLNNHKTKALVIKLKDLLNSIVEVPRIRVEKRQTIETLINEEALLFASYLRDERKSWIPRIAVLLEGKSVDQ